jgi:hypothetical protein
MRGDGEEGCIVVAAARGVETVTDGLGTLAALLDTVRRPTKLGEPWEAVYRDEDGVMCGEAFGVERGR